MSPTDFKNIKVIGFDLDQTLYPKSPEIDSEIQKYIFEKISRKFGMDLETAQKKFEELYHTQGLGGTTTLIKLGFPPEEAGNIVQEALENADIAKFLQPDKTVRELLQKLKNQYAVDLITGSNFENAERKLKKLEIPASLFNHIITADNGSKSTGENYKYWLSFYPQYSPEEFLYIGDRPRTDYEVPSSLGIKCILVNVSQNDAELQCLQLSSLSELKNYLTSTPA